MDEGIEVARTSKHGYLPALMGSENLAVFFWLDEGEYAMGNYRQIDGLGRVNLTFYSAYASQLGSSLKLPSLSYEPSGLVARPTSFDKLYVGVAGIERFLDHYPDFECHRHTMHNMLRAVQSGSASPHERSAA